ncbi:MAG: 4-(cytidine 5'-diphospho)-2-C-methyl-D-erythritol kinase [Bacteroidota bacterium]
MPSLSLKPHAKINLGLIIQGKRPDGYHLLETLLYPIYHFQDELNLVPTQSEGCDFHIEGIELEGDPNDNLVVRAYNALKERVPELPGVLIHLKKQIPAGAGLGGGSSDAAFTLKGLRQLFELEVEDAVLEEIAAGLGADVPFFLYDKPLFAEGIGTKLSNFHLELPYRIELITPGIHSSTIAAYKGLDIRKLKPGRQLRPALAGPVHLWREYLDNDLESVVFEMHPEIREIKEDLYRQGAIYAAMSGSGSSVFGIFEK